MRLGVDIGIYPKRHARHAVLRPGNLLDAIEFSGRQDNLAVREAGMVGLAFNALMAIAALVSVTVFIPKQAPAPT